MTAIAHFGNCTPQPSPSKNVRDFGKDMVEIHYGSWIAGGGGGVACLGASTELAPRLCDNRNGTRDLRKRVGFDFRRLPQESVSSPRIGEDTVRQPQERCELFQVRLTSPASGQSVWCSFSARRMKRLCSASHYTPC